MSVFSALFSTCPLTRNTHYAYHTDMSKRYVVPEDTVCKVVQAVADKVSPKVFNNGRLGTLSSAQYQIICDAFAQVQSENPRVPTDEQARDMSLDYNNPQDAGKAKFAATVWQRRMYLFPDPVVPKISQSIRKEAMNYWESLHPNSPLIPIEEINGILEIALRGQKAGPK
jgi:hypothetical protein